MQVNAIIVGPEETDIARQWFNKHNLASKIPGPLLGNSQFNASFNITGIPWKQC
jgi:hypothetical protein